ncbi:penicillin-binding protein 1C [Pseudoduganella violaceinigra]|uniref:penicillin-binding protein 1C n=1 Tax=Pseudoduganella violaceinigra TaxID=246602 RepID=UPI0003F7B358|nr:penicillin-binding protein 1C [Pseudoduganella violaceinigra]
MLPGLRTLAGRWRGMAGLAGLAAVAALALLLVRAWPHAPLLAGQAWSHAVQASGGELLRLTLAADEQFRLPLRLDEMPAALPESVLLYEDRWFYWHPGVNPLALLRSAWASATGARRQGGSTISMQLARRLYRIDSRSVGGKLRQAAAALWLEARYGKREILEAYLNLAPYGGNVEGVGAASLVYFRKSAARLVLPEILALAVIPQNPRQRLAGAAAPQALHAARARLWQRWQARHPDDRRWQADMQLALRTEGRATLPFLAPHLVDLLLHAQQQAMETQGVIDSSLDLRVQRVLERVIGGYLRTRADSGVVNASAMLVDTATMQVRALVGSADYGNAAIAGQVNGTLGRRSPGSTLKPFIYGLALDQGLLHPKTVLRDTPSAFGAFTPENFDGRFAGPLTAEDALIRSRNVPAVAVAARLARPDLYDFLQQAGVAHLDSREHYGLALVLGGGEVSMEELVQMYAMLANGGQWRPLTYRGTAAPAQQRPLLSEEAAYITLAMLRRNPRPDTAAPGQPAIAWKTGTSWGFRDAWTAGVFGRYALAVWLGNFDGAGNPALVGVDMAAPLFLRIVDALRAERLDPGPVPRELPPDLRLVEVCAASGDLPDQACPRLVQSWFIAGKSPIKRSTLHRQVWIDQDKGTLACRPGPNTVAKTVEAWGSDVQQLMRQAGLPLRDSGACGETGGDSAPRILQPLRGVRHIVRTAHPEPILLVAQAAGGVRKLFWFVDGALVGRAAPGAALAWQPSGPGHHTVRVADGDGRADARDIDIDLVP